MTMNTNLTLIDLFCGAGGLSYGFEKAGFDVLLGIDNDAKALETFELNHKGSKSICGDITQITYLDYIKPLIGDRTFEATRKWSLPIRNWGKVYGELSIMFEGRL